MTNGTTILAAERTCRIPGIEVWAGAWQTAPAPAHANSSCGATAWTGESDAFEHAVHEMIRQAVGESGYCDAAKPLGPPLSHVSNTSLHGNVERSVPVSAEPDTIVTPRASGRSRTAVLRLDPAAGRAVAVIVIHVPLAVRLLGRGGVIRRNSRHQYTYFLVMAVWSTSQPEAGLYAARHYRPREPAGYGDVPRKAVARHPAWMIPPYGGGQVFVAGQGARGC